ncbi:hypothetical protein [uncultured Methanobrevibacter sp.]|uniref:hypothetical protein n=1 Tax=uncultured Methanobrevibacter sp. TaxID=253161 RepID=UPI0025F6FEDF|nr:hypothetical protein [uncultured Methanobrevibacter sp.]
MIIIIIDVILAIFAVSSLFGIKESQMEIISNDTVHNGDSINIKLSDIDGHSLSNESVKIVMMDNKGKRQSYSITTDSNGIADTTVANKDSGRLTINATFEGNEKFNSSNAVKLIKVREGSSNKNSTNVTGVDAQKSPSQ